MNYKQKYEEALERAKDLHDNHPYGEPPVWSTCEKIFPELKESEDERMIKSFKRLIDAYYDVNFPTPEGFERKDMIAWLEKQGEQNPAWSEKDEWHINNIISLLEQARDRFVKESDGQYPAWITDIIWLKSIKPNHWKPSKEQMKALNAINCIGEISYIGQGNLLIKLYNDLEKL